MFEYNKALVGNAKHLRKNMTDEEKHLWYDCLNKLPIPAKRQKNVGNYILDFYIPQAKIAIEVDGIQHTEKHHAEVDVKRDEALRALGITVLRFRNADVNKNFAAVVQGIIEAIKAKGIEIRDYFVTTLPSPFGCHLPSQGKASKLHSFINGRNACSFLKFQK